MGQALNESGQAESGICRVQIGGCQGNKAESQLQGDDSSQIMASVMSGPRLIDTDTSSVPASAQYALYGAGDKNKAMGTDMEDAVHVKGLDCKGKKDELK